MYTWKTYLPLLFISHTMLASYADYRGFNRGYKHAHDQIQFDKAERWLIPSPYDDAKFK